MKQYIFCTVLSALACVSAFPHRVARQTIEEQLGLPSNSTSIRSNLVDTFDCAGRIYGYYADPDNDCQVFHICYPIVYADGQEETLRWSFICPEQTIFDQATLICARPEDAVPCEEASLSYFVNEEFGKTTPDNAIDVDVRIRDN